MIFTLDGATITLGAVAVSALTISSINCLTLIRLNRTLRARNKELEKQAVLSTTIAELLIALYPDNVQPDNPSKAHKLFAINKLTLARSEINRLETKS